MEGGVGLTVATTVEPVPLDVPGGGRQRGDAAEFGEAGLVGYPLRVVASGDQELGGVLDPEAAPLQERRRPLTDQRLDHRVEISELVVEFRVAAGQGLDRDTGG